MPRTARADRAGVVYHIVTRGNARAVVFHDDADYAAIAGMIARSSEVEDVGVLAWCLMPNHMHLVARPRADGGLGRWMQRLLTAHVVRHSQRHATIGRIWQGRFKAFPIQEDRHLLTVLRYVERNPVRAGLVRHAAEWPWSSGADRMDPGDPSARDAEGDTRPLLEPSPVALPEDWRAILDEPLAPSDERNLRDAARAGHPYGNADWTLALGQELGLPVAPTRTGRPRLAPELRLRRTVRRP